ncbi:hypothetical protein ACGFZU_42230 [Streptomyces tendae]|uniref:hypothetical protein n=1 Tax=Streptomyces tendae TaxID=1932 RepID=UPI003721B34C
MITRRGQAGGLPGIRRHLVGGLLLVAAALAVMMLLAPQVGAADKGPSPAPSPSASFPTYEPGLEPTPPGLLPPESVNPTSPEKQNPADGAKDAAKDGADKAKKPPSAQETKETEQEKLRRDMRKKVEEYKARHGDGGVLSAFEVTDSNGLPIYAYRVVSDNGGITDISGQIQGTLAQALFEATKWTIAFGCWLISWALSWALASIFLKPATAVSDALYNQAIVQLGVPGLLMAYSGVVAFWNITFGNSSRGWGEVAASTVIGALAVSTFAAPPQMLLGQEDGAVGKARNLGIALYAITTGHEDSLPDGTITETKARDLTRPVTDGLVEAFVVRPSFLLSYNQQLSDKCIDQYSDSRVKQAFFNEQVSKAAESITKDPSGFGWVPSPVQAISESVTTTAVNFVADRLGLNPGADFEKSCVKDAGAAKKAGWDKVGGALFIFIAAVLMMVLLMVTAYLYLTTQMRLVIEAMLVRVALTAGIMPGAGRAWLWERAANVVRLLGLLIALVEGLALAIMLVTTLLNDEAGFGYGAGALPARFVAVDIAVISCFIFRKRITRRSKAWATSARARMGNGPLGGSAPTVMNRDAGRKRSLAATLATTALTVGAIAASGGPGSALALGGRGSTMLTRRLGARMAVRGTTAMATGAGKAVAGTAKAAYGAGKFGLKYSVGAPVYLPQAARTATAAAKAMPSNITRSASQLRSRLTQPVIRQIPAVRDFSQTYWNNIGGRWASNRIRMHRGLPPRPHPHTRPPITTRPAVPAPTRPTGPRTAPAAAPAARPRPPRRATRPTPQPAASTQQQALRLRLYRMSTDAARSQRPAPASPEPPAPTPPAAPRPRAARPAPARRRRP